MKSDLFSQLRKKFESLDLELLRLLNERASTSLEMGKLKAEENIQVSDPAREQAVFAYLADHNEGPLGDADVEEIFKLIMSISKRLQTSTNSSGAGPDETHEVLKTNAESFPVSGDTALFCILGNPIGHSLSPLMHNTAFRHLGLDAVYLPFEVEDLPGAVKAIKTLRIKGASVTIPFKKEVIDLVDDVDDTAGKIGAVNTLIFNENGVHGTNTDWVGAVKSLESMLPIEGNSFVVIGAGGAARAVVYGITTGGGEAIVVNRSEKKGQALAEEFNSSFVPLSKIEDLKADCLVNTTPVGMHPKEDEMPVFKKILGSYRAVADVIYNPLRTKLVREAEKAGCMVTTGFEMFVYQGVEQLQLWTGKDAPVELMKKVVYERLARG